MEFFGSTFGVMFSGHKQKLKGFSGSAPGPRPSVTPPGEGGNFKASGRHPVGTSGRHLGGIWKASGRQLGGIHRRFSLLIKWTPRNTSQRLSVGTLRRYM